MIHRGFEATGTPEKAFGERLGCWEWTTGKDPPWNPGEIQVKSSGDVKVKVW